MSQTEKGWADPKAIERPFRVAFDTMLAVDELRRQVEEPTEQELAAEEARLP